MAFFSGKLSGWKTVLSFEMTPISGHMLGFGGVYIGIIYWFSDWVLLPKNLTYNSNNSLNTTSQNKKKTITISHVSGTWAFSETKPVVVGFNEGWYGTIWVFFSWVCIQKNPWLHLISFRQISRDFVRSPWFWGFKAPPCNLEYILGVSLNGGTPKTPQNDHF